MSVERVWLLSCLLSCLMIASSANHTTSSPKAVCTRLENYTVTSMETYKEPVTVETFTWCLQFPPRCNKARTEMRERYMFKAETRTRTVKECCEGFKMVSTEMSGDMCVPICKECVVGRCVSPNRCECFDGYAGENCTIVCGPNAWAPECKQECTCEKNVFCNNPDGKCPCPSGFTGLMCNEPCPNHLWGSNCTFWCDCDDNRCDPQTGRCYEDEMARNETVEAATTTIADDQQESSALPETTETLETKAGDEASVATDHLPETTSPETTTVSTPDQPRIRTQTTEQVNPSTARPVIVLVSVPERRRNLEKDKFAIQNPFLRHRDDDVEDHPQKPPPLKSDYDKNIHKDMMHLSSIPLDIALIVVASIFSLGLTSVAVVLVLYMRSKLLESVRVSIYEVEKTKSQENTGTIDKRSSSMVNTSAQSPIREIPAFFTSTPEAGTILKIPNIDPNSNYANGAATIGFRISGNLRDLLQDDHYDRPPSTRIRLQTFGCETATEHVYDEIPL